jgi:ribosomal protein L13
MKLQKQKTDYIRNYSKYVVVIPEDKIQVSGFKEGDELEANATKGKIELKKK